MTKRLYLECSCMGDEHTLKFTLDADACPAELYTTVFLNQYRGILKRIWIAIKYVLGYKCRYGHFDCTLIKTDDACCLIALLQDYRRLAEEQISSPKKL